MKNLEQFDASGEINKLLKSEKSSDEVEKESRGLLSKKMHEYKLEELKEELVSSRDPVEDIQTTDINEITSEEIDSNVEKFKKIIENEKRLEFVNELAKKFPEANFYIVGGMVRDALIGKKSKDIDMVICGIDRDDLETALLKYGKLDFVGRNYGVYKLWLNEKFIPDGGNLEQKEIDIALPRIEKSGGSGSRKDFEVDANEKYKIEDDLARRDLTVNAMAYDVVNKEFIDPFGAKQDLIKHEIRSVGNPNDRFKEDYSRILRAMRFAIKLNARIEDNTWNSIKNNVLNLTKKINDKDGKEIQLVPWEVIGSEIKKMFLLNPVRSLDLLDKSSALKNIIPELLDLKNLEQPKKYHREGDVFTHTRLVLKALPPDSSLTLIFAGLLHDIGKAKTYEKSKDTGKITFYDHAKVSAQMAKEICERLKFTKENSKKICLLVEKHMQIHEIERMKISKIYKLLMEELPKELLCLGKADVLGCLSNELVSHKFAKEKIREFAKKKEEIRPLINGKDLLALGLAQGPIFKKILDKLFELQIKESIINKSDMLKYAEEIVKENFIEM